MLFSKKLKHLKEKDLNMLIDHIKVEEECLTYEVILTAGYLLNDPTITVKDLVSRNFKDAYFSGIKTKIETESNDAITILKHVCLLDPDVISLRILTKIKTGLPLNDVLQIIVNYNLCKIVNPNTEEFGISVHRILQYDIEKDCLKKESEKQQTVCVSLVDLRC